jgi:hypothetical protein
VCPAPLKAPTFKEEGVMKRGLAVLGAAIALVALPGTVLADQGGDNGGHNDHHRQATRFFTDMNGTLEVPSVVTSATGNVVLKVRKDGTVTYRVTLEDIHGVVVSHIHAPAAPGTNASPVQFLCGSAAVGAPPGTPACTDEGFSGTFKVTALLLQQIRSGLAYVNVHTTAHGGGEIRGWLASEDNGGNNGGNND